MYNRGECNILIIMQQMIFGRIYRELKMEHFLNNKAVSLFLSLSPEIYIIFAIQNTKIRAAVYKQPIIGTADVRL